MAEHLKPTVADALADMNLELARRVAAGDNSAEGALDLGIRASLLQARKDTAAAREAQKQEVAGQSGQTNP